MRYWSRFQATLIRASPMTMASQMSRNFFILPSFILRLFMVRWEMVLVNIGVVYRRWEPPPTPPASPEI